MDVYWVSSPLYVAWASFYMLKGLPTSSDAGEGKKGKRLCAQCCTVLSYLLLTAGDKGIKCPSRSLGQHRGGPLGAPPFATMAVACHRTPQAAQCPATCLWGKPRSDAWAGELVRRSEVATCRGEWLAAVGVFPRLRACRSSGLAGAHGAPRRASLVVPGLGLPGGLLPPGPWCSGSVVPASSSCRGLASLARQAPLAGALSSCLECSVFARPQKEGPLRLLALPWRALPQGATTARAQVRGTKVPL